MRFALAILISILALTAQADGIYKWVDKDGVVHFGAQPPMEKEVEVVRKPKSDRYKQWQAEQQALIAAKQEETSEDDATAEAQNGNREPAGQDDQVQQQLTKAQQAVQAQRCRMAQSNLQELQTHSRVREVGADGKVRVLPEGERQQRIANAQRTIQENC